MNSTEKPSTWSRQAVRLAAPLAMLAMVLSGCSQAPAPAPAPASQSDAESTADSVELLERFGLQGLNAAQVIDQLEQLPVAERPANLMASVRPGQLVLSDEAGRQAAMQLPADKFYLSVAPYESQTHDCHFHSLTTCLGELQNADVIVDFTTNDGTKVLDGKQLATNDNGFVGLWLPSGVTGELTITAGGKTSTQSISTAGSEDATCLTTMQVV